MKRRRVLIATGVSLVGAISGCLDMIGGDVRVVPDDMSVEGHHTTGPTLEDGLLGLQDEIDSYHTLITDMATAQERLAPAESEDGGGPTADPEARAFIEDTDFDQSYIVIIQYGMPSLRWLDLRKIERMNGGIRVTVETDDDGYNDDWAVHSKIIRITDQEEGVPDDVDVEVDGEPTDLSEVADR